MCDRNLVIIVLEVCVSHAWFTKYLLNRKQMVSYNFIENCRLSGFVNSGVPQGSIVDPLHVSYTCLKFVTHLSCFLTSYLLTTRLIFYSKADLDSLYGTVNCELKEVFN